MIRRYILKQPKINSMNGVKSQSTLPEILFCASSTEYQPICHKKLHYGSPRMHLPEVLVMLMGKEQPITHPRSVSFPRNDLLGLD